MSNSLKGEDTKPKRPMPKSRSVYSTVSLFPLMQPKALLKKVFDQLLSTVTIRELICYLLVLQDLIFRSKNKIKEQALKVALIKISKYIDKKLYAIVTSKLKV